MNTIYIKTPYVFPKKKSLGFVLVTFFIINNIYILNKFIINVHLLTSLIMHHITRLPLSFSISYFMAFE